MSRKRVIKLDIGYLRSIIDSIRTVNGLTDSQVQNCFEKSKGEVIENIVGGLERSIEEAIWAKDGAPKSEA